MKLPEHLKKKRDELAEKHLDEFDLSPPTAFLSFCRGYNNACAELLPMIEMLEKDLERQPRYTENNENELVELHSFAIAREALAELKKWRES